jgi:hypothetical protein
MLRLTRYLLLAAAVVAGTLFTAFQADASAPPCIRQTTDQYRDAVSRFEDEVDRSRSAIHGNRYDVRRLRQLADRFHSVVRHHDDYFRYASSWQDLSEMHYRVEQSFVAGCRHSDPRLFRAWAHVSLQYDRLSEAVHFQARVCHGRSSAWDHRGGNDHFGQHHFDRGRDRYNDDFRGRDPFGSPYSSARPPVGHSVHPVTPVRLCHRFAAMLHKSIREEMLLPQSLQLYYKSC